ncbi:hypothetical protein D3C86_2016970 [compost metagenome]
MTARSSIWLRKYAASDKPSSGMKLAASKASKSVRPPTRFKPNEGSSRKMIIAKLIWACQRLFNGHAPPATLR